ncbi:hypothetical protein M8J75_012548 [Diaphorina citri]|nr:hypothetical protein M8J75_012548 [Diaphorina citri]KAI5747040.1 hypothetical protein M8J77_010458 [Diaphorina citri]
MYFVSKARNSKPRMSRYLRILLKVVHWLGLINMPCKNEKVWIKYVHLVFMCFIHVVYWLYMLSNLICLVHYANRGLTKFIPRLCDGIGFVAVYLEAFIFIINRKRVGKLLDILDKFDTTSNKDLTARCRKLETIACCFVPTFVFVTVGMKMMEKSQASLVFYRSGYTRDYPDTLLPYVLWIPGLDFSKSSVFLVAYLFELYITLIIISMVVVLLLFVPLILLHLSAQKHLLADGLKMLGFWHPHQRPVTMTCNTDLCLRTRDLELKREQIHYELVRINTLIRFHQKLVAFRVQFDDIFKVSFRYRVLITTALTALNILQVMSLDLLPPQERVMVINQAIMSMTFYFYINLMSQSLEWSQTRICRAAYKSRWYTMCPEAKRSLLMFLRRTQRRDFMRPLNGMMVLGTRHFMKLLKLIYSFIGFMQSMKKSASVA